jgi:hypothetical protein
LGPAEHPRRGEHDDSPYGYDEEVVFFVPLLSGLIFVTRHHTLPDANYGPFDENPSTDKYEETRAAVRLARPNGIGRSAASVRFAKISAPSEAKTFNIEILGWVAGSFFAGYNNRHGA